MKQYGAEVIDRWGGVADLDGNGRILVYLDAALEDTPLSGVVWIGDMLSTSECPASNEGELITLNRDWLEIPFVLATTLVHEA